MGLIHFLTPDEDLEVIRTNLSKKIGRPVYIASTLTWGGSDCIYRQPGKRAYKSMGRLELFLSGWDDGISCVGKSGDMRKFDLREAPTVCLVYPLLPEERKGLDGRWSDQNFKSVGLYCALNGEPRVVYPSVEDEVPDELEPFLLDYQLLIRNEWKTKKGIRFAISEVIEAPIECRDTWNLGTDFSRPDKTYKEETYKGYTAVTVQAPGHYSGLKITDIESINRICFVDRDPGKCICCHGRSGARKHFAIVVTGQAVYTDGLICMACLPNAAKKWQELLDNWVPSQIPSEEVADLKRNSG